MSLALLSFTPVYSAAEGLKPKKELSKEQRLHNFNELSHGKLKFSQKNGKVFLSGKLSGKQITGKKSAVEFLEENKNIFGINSASKDLKVMDVKKDDTGDTFVKFAQLINGIEVNDSSVNVHFDKDGSIVSVNGKLEENEEIQSLGNKDISEDTAIEIAERQFHYKTLRNTPEAQKVIFTKNSKNYEVYRINISYIEPTIGNYEVFVEVNSGKVINIDNNIKYDGKITGSGIDVLGKNKNLNLYLYGSSYKMVDLTKSATSGIYTYSLNHATSGGTLVSSSTKYFNTENYKASVSAHYNAGKVIDFYKKLFNRNSLDNKGMPIYSYTHYDNNYDNAFWDGYEMIYGDGDGEEFTYLSGDLDVVGHEMTHGLIDNTAQLDYNNQSGALNESLADIFGVLISTYDEYNVASGENWTFNTADWQVGQDIYTPGIPGDAVRSLSDPTLYDQPDNMSNYENLPDTEDGDWGGVHVNSGIPSKAAYLVAKTIGMYKTAKIYYRALVNYMEPYTNFEDARNCLAQAAADLYGQDSVEVTAISNAFSSVGVGQASAQDFYEPNDTMAAAYNINFGTTYKSYISSAADSDYFKININNIGFINIVLSNLPYDYTLQLYNGTGQLVGQSASSGTASEVINYNVSKTGIYYIKILTNSNYSTTQKYSLTVTKKVASVALNSASVNLKPGESINLTAAISPADASNKNMVWTSSNPSVIQVSSSGRVTTIGNGKAVIAVTTEDGGYKAYCSITAALLASSWIKAVSSSYNSIITSWAPVSGASGYEVYMTRYASRPYALIARTSSTGYNSTGLSIGANYYYKVRAFRMVGISRVYSGFTSVTAGKPVMSVPLNLKAAKVNSRSIKLNWNASSGANGYEIYRSGYSNGKYSLIKRTPYLNYINPLLTSNRVYYYKIRAFRIVNGNKVYSNWTSIVHART